MADLLHNNYYINQLNNINLYDYYGVQIKIKDSENETNWLTLNDKSIDVLINWLNSKKEQLLIVNKKEA